MKALRFGAPFFSSYRCDRIRIHRSPFMKSFLHVSAFEALGRSMSKPDASSIDATKQPMLVYDGECGFCSRSIQFILRREREHELLFVTRQSELGVRLRRQYGLETMESMLWIEDGKALTESSAVLRIAGYVGGWCRIAAIGVLNPAAPRSYSYLPPM